jgi:hypothetical protein
MSLKARSVPATRLDIPVYRRSSTCSITLLLARPARPLLAKFRLLRRSKSTKLTAHRQGDDSAAAVHGLAVFALGVASFLVPAALGSQLHAQQESCGGLVVDFNLVRRGRTDWSGEADAERKDSR